jgi:hypothetical protein
MDNEFSRIETGPAQFGEDWPFIAIRGDHALHYAQSLGFFLKLCEQQNIQGFDSITLHSLLYDLTSCFVREGIDPKDIQYLKPFPECKKN